MPSEADNLVILAADRTMAVAVHALDPECAIVGHPDGAGGTMIATDGRRGWIHFAFPPSFVTDCEALGCEVIPYTPGWKQDQGWVDWEPS